jgi:hypothetical protein
MHAPGVLAEPRSASVYPVEDLRHRLVIINIDALNRHKIFANVLGYPGDDVSPLVLKRLVKRQGFQEVAELRILSEDQIRQPRRIDDDF